MTTVVRKISDMHAIIHICRDFEYRGGVENYLFDFVQHNNEYKHIIISTEGAPGERTQILKKRGFEIIYIAGSFKSKVGQINRIVSMYDLPILHTHLCRPEKLGVFVRGCHSKVTTKYATYATDSQTGNGFIDRLSRIINNKILDYLVTLFYCKVFIISNELESKWSFLGNKIERVALSTVLKFGDYRKSHFLNDSMIIICAARMVKEKAHDLMIESLRNVSFSKLYLLGDGPLREDIQKHISRVGLKNVEMPGVVSREKVLEYMLKSDLMLLTSYTEGLPLLIQEAMSVGLVVVASDVGGNSELIDDSIGRVVQSRTAFAFSDAINSLIGKDIGEMGNRAIDRCKKKFNMFLTIRKINDVYCFLKK